MPTGSPPKPKWHGIFLDEFDFLDDPTPLPAVLRDPNFPHTCPACHKPAYIGLNRVLCTDPGCIHKGTK